VLRASGLWQRLGDEKLFLDVHGAAESLVSRCKGAT
jgi:hypothetical protein